MATYLSYNVPASPTAATLFNGTAGASATFILAPKQIIGIATAGGTLGNVVNVRFGSALKPPTATANDWAIPINTVQFFDLGSEFDRVAIFSAGTTPSFWIYAFSRT